MRREALAAARELLLANGPSAVTLMAVAERVQRTHSTILHHFGSAEELHAALMSSMVEDLSRSLGEALSTPGPTEARARLLVDTVFDAFDDGGAGILAAWIMLTNKERFLEPVRSAVELLAHDVDAHIVRNARVSPRQVPNALLFLALCALADSLIGRGMRGMMQMDDEAMRQLAVRLVPYFLKPGTETGPLA